MNNVLTIGNHKLTVQQQGNTEAVLHGRDFRLSACPVEVAIVVIEGCFYLQLAKAWIALRSANQAAAVSEYLKQQFAQVGIEWNAEV